jgi:hypothetical protein
MSNPEKHPKPPLVEWPIRVEVPVTVPAFEGPVKVPVIVKFKELGLGSSLSGTRMSTKKSPGWTPGY